MSHFTSTGRMIARGVGALALAVLVAPSAFGIERVALSELDFEVKRGIEGALRGKLAEFQEQKNEDGVSNVKGTYSKLLTRIDDSSYRATIFRNTAKKTQLVTDRMAVTVTKTGDKKGGWTVAAEEVQDTFDGLYRPWGGRCYPFEEFSFDRHGLKMTATNGGVCEFYEEGKVDGFVVGADDLKYDYRAPNYLDYYQLQRFLVADYQDQMEFNPQLFKFSCDPTSCEELLSGSFTGLTRAAAPAAAGYEPAPSGIPSELVSYVEGLAKETEKERRENPFGEFDLPYFDGHKYYRAEVRKDSKNAVGIVYNNWDGFEVQFWAEIDWPDVGHVTQPVFGYYTDETLASQTPYDLERRDDFGERWFDLSSVKGEVEAGLDDPEMLRGDINYGINIRTDTNVLQFAVATLPRENVTKPTMFISSVEFDGQDLTWVQTSPFTGLIVFPETLKAGAEIDLRIIYASRAIRKENYAFSRTPRGAWMPLVSFGDFIDEFELTIKVPSKYTTLGIGKKMWEKRDGKNRVSHWVAENPVVFPSIIYGQYVSDSPRIEAKKLDGTPIPVTAFVDEVSMGQLDVDVSTQRDAEEFSEAASTGSRGIRQKQIRTIAEQAVNSINLYNEISGVDYPYGELNLVNDPSPALYGQAPSSLIYLGSFVFRGEGTMAGDSLTGGLGGGGAGTAKFLKSVVAHEVGHQWWGSRVANANSRNYWFVESLAEYFSALYLEAVYGPKEYQEQVDDWRRTVLDTDLRSNVQHASVLFPGADPRSYQAAVYSKGPYAFHMLRQTFGDEKFFPFLKQFTKELTEKGEIVTRDIQIAAESGLGGIDENGNPYKVDLSWFFDQWIRGTGLPQYTFNYEVRQAEDGNYIVEGNINQRVVVGHKRKYHVLEDTYYRGVVPIRVKTSEGKEYRLPVIVEGQQTPFRLPPLPGKPIEVALNQNGDILSHEVLVNRDF